METSIKTTRPVVPRDTEGNAQLRKLRLGEQFGPLTVTYIRYRFRKQVANVLCTCVCGEHVHASVEGLLMGNFDGPCPHITKKNTEHEVHSNSKQTAK